jgi:hypothetical protein
VGVTVHPDGYNRHVDLSAKKRSHIRRLEALGMHGRHRTLKHTAAQDNPTPQEPPDRYRLRTHPGHFPVSELG